MAQEPQVSIAQRVIRQIPAEIYLEILSHFEPQQEFKSALFDLKPNMTSGRNHAIQSMALTCRDFYDGIFPHLFEIIFVAYPLRDEDPATHCDRFCQSVANGDPRARLLATNVKTFVMAGFDLQPKLDSSIKDTTSIPAKCLQLASICSKALECMSGLRELHISQSALTKELIHAIASLPVLKTLHMEGCDIDHSLDRSALTQFANLRISTLWESRTTLFNRKRRPEPLFEDFLEAYSLPNVRQLNSYGADSIFLRRIALIPPMSNLESIELRRLEIAPTATHELADALKAVPMLKSLLIHHIAYDHEGDGPFVVSYGSYPSLSMLESIRAPLNILKAIVPGTRVSSIGFATERIGNWYTPVPYFNDNHTAAWNSVVTTFKSSSRVVQALDIPMHFYLSVGFVDSFPGLRSLTIRPLHENWFDEDDPAGSFLCGKPDEIVASFLSAWEEHPGIVELAFAYEYDAVPITRQEGTEGGMLFNLSNDSLNALKLRIPTLERLVFSVTSNIGDDQEKFEFVLGVDEDA